LKNICKIIKKTQLCKEVFDFEVEFSHRPLPGQFIHVLCGDGVFLRRPISICDYNEGILRFSFAVRGEGTKRLANHNEGDMLDILGPLGRGFDTGKSGEGTAVVVGGGIGIFPLYFLSKRIKTEAILGFRTKDAVIMEDDFKSFAPRFILQRMTGATAFTAL
jgi:dihydroorotate dehydrogenase electron transfer subunit